MSTIEIIAYIILMLVAFEVTIHQLSKHFKERYRRLSLIEHISKCVVLALSNADGWDDMFVDMLDDFKSDDRMQQNTIADFHYLANGLHELNQHVQNSRGDGISITLSLSDAYPAANQAILEILEYLSHPINRDDIRDKVNSLDTVVLPSMNDIMELRWGAAV
ncbi:hypothetical protein [Ferrimicrobium acidiphilum]|jgi:hypothetical protein|uniref:hypothetical protein n=1 Tax=Ferrimicrobium acidiphilum TaxID=121039 RepID=UPI0023F4CA6D|nr:hypothetical protein [Ferrimicrobium acidiphilum]